MQTFRTDLLRTQGSRAELLITIELFLMILHISMDELECFAGKHGGEAASQAITSLERWFGIEESRKAVWHAGQVSRWATHLSSTDLRDFYAVAVYHAGILLWDYGIYQYPTIAPQIGCLTSLLLCLTLSSRA